MRFDSEFETLIGWIEGHMTLFWRILENKTSRTMTNHDETMTVKHHEPWRTMTKPWWTMMNHDETSSREPWQTMTKHHELWWNITNHDELWRTIMKHHEPWWTTTNHFELSQNITNNDEASCEGGVGMGEPWECLGPWVKGFRGWVCVSIGGHGWNGLGLGVCVLVMWRGCGDGCMRVFGPMGERV